ncbi:cytochrome P450 6k1-like [Papilio machaon]|uniref:cytochrome P450 6k1-like n=1 Tax=Papilio machaon TaxID=76193 RepID=UPI001E665D0A|nr:cytochrome P450 6k1-like [Papilio machaon]
MYFQMLVLLTIILLLILTWLAVRWRRVRRYWADLGVPYLPPHPILGSLTFLQKQNAGLWMRDLYGRVSTPYLGLWLFWRPALLVNSPDIARRILVKDSAVFRDRFLSSGTKDPIGGRNLFTVNDPTWSEMRRRLTVMFTAARLRHLQSFMTLKSKQLMQRIHNDMEKNGHVDVKLMYTDFSTDVIGTTSFGVDSDATLTGKSALRTVTKEFMKYSALRGLGWACIFFYPEMVDVFGFSLFPKSTVAYFRKVYHKIIAQRGGYNGEISENKDLIDLLRKIKQDFEKEDKDIPEDTLIAQAAIFLQGGFDTVSSTLSFCTYELAFLPQLQEKLYKEVCEVKKRNGNKDLDPNALNELTLMQCVMKETFRKYMSMGWLDRVAATDYQVDEKLTIPAGTPVYVNGLGLHYDPNIYPEPMQFNPDRFLPENEKKIPPFTYIPFGEGPRMCIGRRFGEQTFLTALSHVIVNYRILPTPNAKLPADIDIEKKGIFVSPGEKIYTMFKPRI